MFVDIQAGQKPWRDVYKLCIGFINPRPIALVATRGQDGALNLAPYSFFNMVSANPPVIIFAPTVNRHGKMKDTLINVEQTGEFVIATVNADIAQAMNQCAATLPFGQSEFAFSGLTPAPAKMVQAPLVQEAPVNMECRLREVKRIGDGPGSGNVVFGDILAIHIADEILDEHQVPDPRKLTTVGRMGGAWYANADEPYEMKIPVVEREAPK
jgi:flavin reductase (DIM6/NTAB) family NADH-FMN oxidoreductase RutF